MEKNQSYETFFRDLNFVDPNLLINYQLPIRNELIIPQNKKDIKLLELWQLWLKREKIANTRLFYNTKIMTRINALAAQIIGQAIVYTMPDFR